MTLHPQLVREWIGGLAPSQNSPWKQCHAATLLPIDKGLLCAWFAGTAEGAPDNKIWGSIRSGSGRWSAPAVLQGTSKTAHWNPVLMGSPDGELLLFHKEGSRISSWTTWVSGSRDGSTWDAPRKLVPGDRGGRGPVKNPPIITPAGTWLAPASTERWGETEAVWECFIDRSTNGGRNWSSVPIPKAAPMDGGPGLIQPALFRLNGSIGALMRSTSGQAHVSFSHDDGQSFTPAQPTDLPNNNSALAVVDLPDGRLVAIHNPVSGNWAARCPLAVSVSNDAMHWSGPVLLIEDGRTPLQGVAPTLPGTTGQEFMPRDQGVQTTGAGEYSYPAAVVHEDRLLVAYTWQRQAMALASIPLSILAKTHP